jgi:hypothetical protein
MIPSTTVFTIARIRLSLWRRSANSADRTNTDNAVTKMVA